MFSIDEPENAEGKIYIDKNQDGDLTNDGDGSWTVKSTKGRAIYGVMEIALRVSYGTAAKETGSSPYLVGLYRFPGGDHLMLYRETARRGRVVIDGKGHNVMLVDNENDGLYLKKPPTDGDDRPLWLLVDLNDNGKFVKVDARTPFSLGSKVYEANIAPDGFSLELIRSNKSVAAPSKQKDTQKLLVPGATAPDFVAEKWGGGDLHLSDYHGKIVILDFWASWCVPCQDAMPHVEKLVKSLQGQDVVVLGVCVWDTSRAYKEWVTKNFSQYSFQFAFDNHEKAESVASQYKVSGVPTTYVIDKAGKIADAFVGYGDSDTRLEASLRKLGLKFPN